MLRCPLRALKEIFLEDKHFKDFHSEYNVLPILQHRGPDRCKELQ